MSLKRASSSELSRPATLLMALGLTRSGTDVGATWICGSFFHIARLWPLILLSKMCVILILGLLVFRQQGWAQFLLLGLMFLVDGMLMILPRQDRFRSLLPHIQTWAMLPMLFLSGLSYSAWIAGALGWTQTASPALTALSQLVVALLVACIVGDRRLLGMSYFLGLLIAAFIGSAGLIPIGLLSSGLLVMAVATVRQASVDRDRAMAMHRQDLRAQRSDRLLQEHERSGRGWFWETDRQGSLTYISDTLCETMNLPCGSLIGRVFTDILRPGDRQAGDGERTLGFHLSARTGFSEIPVCAALSKEERWWSISGQPVFNEYGQFHGFRGSGTDLTEMRRSQAEVTRLAQYDSLTGLANRIQMLRSLEQAVAARHGRPGECTLMMLDLDRFKQVNDTLGHPAGDELLKQVAARLLRIVGNKGEVGRLGGDEFQIVLPDIDDRGALGDLAQRVIQMVSQPYSINGARAIIGTSLGIAIAPYDGLDTEELVKAADLALYAAKGGGRGRYRFYSSDLKDGAKHRREVEEDLRDAIENEQLAMHFQPLVCSKTHMVKCCEALMRWEHPERGDISGPSQDD